jgi:integrase/recombinase XerD
MYAAHHQITEPVYGCLAEMHIKPREPIFQNVTRGNGAHRPSLEPTNAWWPSANAPAKQRFLPPVNSHTWRATGVTVYLENGGRLEQAQQMASHESPRTTKLYVRTRDEPPRVGLPVLGPQPRIKLVFA